MKKILLAFLLIPFIVNAQTVGDMPESSLGQPNGPAKLDSLGNASSFPVLPNNVTNPRTLSDKLGETKTPADFLTAGQTSSQLLSGSINASPAITLAMNNAEVVFLPCGTYRLDTPLAPSGTAGFSLIGQSASCVTLSYTFASGDVLPLTSSGRPEISDVTFYGQVTRNAGYYVIHLINTYGAILNKVVFDGTRNGDIYVDGANTTRIDQSDFRPGNSGECIAVGGPGAYPTQAVDTFVSHTNLATCGVGIHLTNASGVYLDSMDILGSLTNAVHIGPSASANQNVNAVRTVNVLADSTANHGWLIDGDGPVTEINLNGNWMSGSGLNSNSTAYTGPYAGIYVINANLDGLVIDNLYGHANGAQLIDIEAGTHIKINNPMACNNSRYTAGAYDGILISANADWVTINNPTSGLCGYANKVSHQANAQKYGLNIQDNASQHISVIGGSYDSNAGTWSHYGSSDVNEITAGTPP